MMDMSKEEKKVVRDGVDAALRYAVKVFSELAKGKSVAAKDVDDAKNIAEVLEAVRNYLK